MEPPCKPRQKIKPTEMVNFIFTSFMSLRTICCLALGCLTFTSAQEKLLLWPSGAPNAKGDAETDQPAMFVYRPEKQNGCAVIVFPGGGYGGLATDHEGHQIGRFYNEHGVTAFVVHYRLGSKGYHHPTQLNDAKRAIRTVRHHAKKFGIDPNRIGSMGFSAGGHLCSMTGTLFDRGGSGAKDPIDRASSRPDFLVLCYPVISLSTDFAHGGSRRNLLGGDKPRLSDEVLAVSTELQVKPDTPPAFFFHTTEDTAVPPENSLLFYMAMRRHKIPVELHVYQRGPHGVGLMRGDPILGTWSEHLIDWLRSNEFLGSGTRATAEGSATLNGTPVSWGSATFYPDDPNLPISTARIRRGKFKVGGEGGPVVGPVTVKFSVSIFEATGNPKDGVVELEQKVRIKPGANQFDFALKNL